MKILQSKYFAYLVLFSFALFLFWSFGPMKTIEKKLVNATGSKEMLDLKPAGSPDEVHGYVNKIGPSGRTVLKEMYTYQDFIYPICYGSFFTMALLFFISRVAPKNRKMLLLAVFPVLMMIADYVENSSILEIIEQPSSTTSAAFYLGTITTIKWILGVISILLLLILMSVFGYKKAFRKKTI
jgi:hypothetical protein